MTKNNKLIMIRDYSELNFYKNNIEKVHDVKFICHKCGKEPAVGSGYYKNSNKNHIKGFGRGKYIHNKAPVITCKDCYERGRY